MSQLKIQFFIKKELYSFSSFNRSVK